jgi:sec-independent protein translocase protein TatB
MSFSEIFFLGVLGLVVFGPKKLASIGQQAGQMYARFQKVSREFKMQLEQEVTAAGKAEPAKQLPPAKVAVGEPLGANLLTPSIPALDAD